jgi:hypothetical protein
MAESSTSLCQFCNIKKVSIERALTFDCESQWIVPTQLYILCVPTHGCKGICNQEILTTYSCCLIFFLSYFNKDVSLNNILPQQLVNVNIDLHEQRENAMSIIQPFLNEFTISMSNYIKLDHENRNVILAFNILERVLCACFAAIDLVNGTKNIPKENQSQYILDFIEKRLTIQIYPWVMKRSLMDSDGTKECQIWESLKNDKENFVI